MFIKVNAGHQHLRSNTKQINQETMWGPRHSKTDQEKEATMERLCGQNEKTEDRQMGQNIDTNKKIWKTT